MSENEYVQPPRREKQENYVQPPHRRRSEDYVQPPQRRQNEDYSNLLLNKLIRHLKTIQRLTNLIKVISIPLG